MQKSIEMRSGLWRSESALPRFVILTGEEEAGKVGQLGQQYGGGVVYVLSLLLGYDYVLLLYHSKYKGSEDVSMPFLSYQPGQTSTTYSSGITHANVYGSGGYAYGTGNYSGMSTTTSPGTFSTTMASETVQVYSHQASFWRKAKPSILGLITVNLSDGLRKNLHRNTGALVKMVVDDSPAFKANILPGDIVIGIDDISIDSTHDFHSKILQFAGKKCDIHILREGEAIIIPVQMNINAE